MKFIGTTAAKMDAKGRVFFPSAYRKQMNETETEFILRRDAYQPCLVIYPLDVWEQEVDRLRERLNRWNPQEAMVFRRFLADAEVLTLDTAGRFLISKRLQRLVGLEREVTFVGADDRLELWAAEQTEACFPTDADFGDALQQLLGGTTT